MRRSDARTLGAIDPAPTPSIQPVLTVPRAGRATAANREKGKDRKIKGGGDTRSRGSAAWRLRRASRV